MLASACAAVKDPPDPIASSGDRPAVLMALRNELTSTVIAHASVSANFDISVAYGLAMVSLYGNPDCYR